MRQNLLTAVRRFCTAFVGVALLASCNLHDPNAERSEFIKVYASLEDMDDPEVEPAKALAIGVREGSYEFFVKTNVSPDELSFEWQDDQSSPWAKVEEVQEVSKGVIRVSIWTKARSAFGYYTRRTGMLMIYASDIHLGKYLRIHQGCVARYSNDCATFKSGSTNPLVADGEALWSTWTASQKENFPTTTPTSVYARNGFLRLGDNIGHGGEITTKFVDALRADSLLMVNFRAVAFQDELGKKDANKFTVEVLGGGVFKDTDGAKKLEVEIPYYNIDDPDFPTSMWNDAEFMYFVENSESSKISANTRIRLTAGSLTEMTEPNRVFVTRIYIRTINPQVDEDYFEENGGNGVDRILGLSSEKPAPEE